MTESQIEAPIVDIGELANSSAALTYYPKLAKNSSVASTSTSPI